MHNRGSERRILKRKLEAGVNIHMPAPRRIGKTWTINKLADDLRKAEWQIVEVDVQGLSAPEDFARKLCQKIREQVPQTAGLWAGLKERFKVMTGEDWGGNPIQALGRMDPISFLDALIKELSKTQKPSAIFVDEIAYFVLAVAENNPSRAKDFFYQLRGIQSENSSVRWLFTGSIGLGIVAERFGLRGAFVDLEDFILEPFTQEEARSFMRDGTIQTAFTNRFQASDDDLAHVFAELGWLAPYYLNLVGNEVRPSGYEHDGIPTATRDDFKAAFERLLGPNRKTCFAVWPEHVDKNLPQPDRQCARKLLDRLSQETDGETKDTLIAASQCDAGQLRQVLNILINDGLLHKREDRYCFRSGLVRRYWQEYEAQ